MMLSRSRATGAQEQNERSVSPIVPKGILVHLSVDQIKPNPNNPRRLFDPAPLKELTESIKTHGVLVPITVYKLPGQEKYGIVDGERRFRCCVDLHKEGIDVQIPANVVEAPNTLASLIYMFNIHAFREQWELMPTALSIKQIMRSLNTKDSAELHEITGLSFSQIERCKKILSFPEEFQELSLDADPSKRIPSNFWVELYPVLEKTPELVPDLYSDLGRDGITQRMVEKYRAGQIKSVIHFRRILEAIENAEETGSKDEVADRLREYVLTLEFETRKAFDGFIQDTKKVQKAVGVCDKFIGDLERAKVDYTIEGKDEVIMKLLDVIDYAQRLLDRLQGDEPPGDIDNVSGTGDDTNG